MDTSNAPVINLREQNSFLYHREITRPWGGIDAVITWCKSELTADWRWQVIEMSSDVRPGRYAFYFDSERDCCAFTLKWVD